MRIEITVAVSDIKRRTIINSGKFVDSEYNIVIGALLIIIKFSIAQN